MSRDTRDQQVVADCDTKDEGRRRWRLSIRSLLMVCYSGLLIVAVGLVFFFNFGAATQNTFALQSELANGFVESAQRHIESEKTPLEAQAAWLGLGFADGSLSLMEPKDLALVMSGALAGTPTLDYIGILDDNGDGIVVDGATGEPELVAGEDMPVSSELFEMATTVNRPIWLPPLHIDGQVFITHVTPLYYNGYRVASLFQSKTLEGVARRLLRNMSVEGMGNPFILYDRKRVMTHRALEGHYGKGLEEALPLLDGFDDPALSRFNDMRSAYVPKAARHSGFEVGVVEVDWDDYFFIYKDIYGFSDRKLTVGMYFNEDYDSEEMDRLGKSMAGSLLVLLIAVGLSMKVSAWTSRPISALSAASVQIGRGEYDQVGELGASHLKELDDAAGAFNNMVRGIQERKRAHELFGRVVPLSVAERMLRSEGGLEPQSTTGTILFVDLQGFTSLAEDMTPQNIVSILNAYFTDMVDIIEGEGGIITQFQGDAILAVFNVPTPVPDHASKAIRAALLMEKRLNGKLYDGYRLKCRIGLNTGPFIAGNVGAQSRMNYTVHGDAVNVAARLEQLNKEHDTTILASADTVEAAGVAADFLTSVNLRGKSRQIGAYVITDKVLAR